MRLARTHATREIRGTPLELAAGPAGEHDDLVVVGVVRLHVHESICLLRHLESPFVSRCRSYRPARPPRVTADSARTCVRRLPHAHPERSGGSETDGHDERAGNGVEDVVV